MLIAGAIGTLATLYGGRHQSPAPAAWCASPPGGPVVQYEADSGHEHAACWCTWTRRIKALLVLSSYLMNFLEGLGAGGAQYTGPTHLAALYT